MNRSVGARARKSGLVKLTPVEKSGKRQEKRGARRNASARGQKGRRRRSVDVLSEKQRSSVKKNAKNVQSEGGRNRRSVTRKTKSVDDKTANVSKRREKNGEPGKSARTKSGMLSEKLGSRESAKKTVNENGA